MLGVGLFVDGLRHLLEWVVERLCGSDGRQRCAFYPRIFVEDVDYLRYNPREKEAARTLLEKKLKQYNIRYFMAEGFLSFAIGCLISGGLYMIACSPWSLSLFGLPEKTSDEIGKITFASWFIIIVTPLAILISFLWCRDKFLLIRSLLPRREIQLWCPERRVYFSIFIFLYITSLWFHSQLESFKNNEAQVTLGILFLLGTSFLAIMFFYKTRHSAWGLLLSIFIIPFWIIMHPSVVSNVWNIFGLIYAVFIFLVFCCVEETRE